MKGTLAKRERKRLAEAFPSLTLDTWKHPATVKGVVRLDSGVGFTVHLEVPGSYPHGVPIMKCDPKEIPWEADRHVHPDSGTACLCVASEYRKYWPYGSDLTDFLKVLVRPYLIGQAYYQVHGLWPLNHERSHGFEGIIEAYRDLLGSLGTVSETTIRSFMELLARPRCPKGHELCPCGNGARLRNCHRSLLVELRRVVDPIHARGDLELLNLYAKLAGPT